MTALRLTIIGCTFILSAPLNEMAGWPNAALAAPICGLVLLVCAALAGFLEMK